MDESKAIAAAVAEDQGVREAWERPRVARIGMDGAENASGANFEGTGYS